MMRKQLCRMRIKKPLEADVTSEFTIRVVQRQMTRDKNERWYQAGEFVELIGVTVRAPHHYDRLGLLRPARRNRAGYRLYSVRDAARLEQDRRAQVHRLFV